MLSTVYIDLLWSCLNQYIFAIVLPQREQSWLRMDRFKMANDTLLPLLSMKIGLPSFINVTTNSKLAINDCKERHLREL